MESQIDRGVGNLSKSRSSQSVSLYSCRLPTLLYIFPSTRTLMSSLAAVLEVPHLALFLTTRSISNHQATKPTELHLFISRTSLRSPAFVFDRLRRIFPIRLPTISLNPISVYSSASFTDVGNAFLPPHASSQTDVV